MEKEAILQIFKDYISGAIRLNELEDWVLSHIQGILNSGNQKAINIINQVDALIIEIGENIASEEELLNLISGIISDSETISFNMCIKPSDVSIKSIEFSSDNRTTERQAEFDFDLLYA